MLVCVERFKERLTNKMKKIIFALIITLFAQEAQSASVKQDFIVHVGPFDAGRTEFEYDLGANKFSVLSKVSTNGLIDVIYPFTASYQSIGKILKSQKLQTQKYTSLSQSSSTRRSKEMYYNAAGLPTYRISAKNNKSKRVEIEQDTNNLGTTDLQTALGQIAYQYNHKGTCANKLEIFDGKKRFSIIFEDRGTEELVMHELSPNIKGSAHKCIAYIDKLDNDDDDLIWTISKDNPIHLWLQTDEKSKLAYIARIHMEDTPLGELNAYTTAITIKQ